MVGSEISASEVRSQEFKALKPLSKVRGHHFRPIFSRTVPHVFVPTGIFWQPESQSANYVYIEGCNYRACSACSISSLSFAVVALLHWLNADIWVMYVHVFWCLSDLDSFSSLRNSLKSVCKRFMMLVSGFV